MLPHAPKRQKEQPTWNGTTLRRSNASWPHKVATALGLSGHVPSSTELTVISNTETLLGDREQGASSDTIYPTLQVYTCDGCFVRVLQKGG